MEEKQVIYGSLPFFKRMGTITKDKFTEFKKNYKFPWVKLIIFLIVVAIVAVILGIVLTHDKPFPTKAAYDKTGFVAASDFSDNEVVYENQNYKFILDTSNTHFTLTDKSNSKVWSSKPTDRDAVDTLVLYYPRSLGIANSLGNYSNSINYEGTKNFELRVNEEDNSVEVLYTVGGKIKLDYTDFPLKIDKEKFENQILGEAEAKLEELRANGGESSEISALNTAIRTTKSLYLTASDLDYYTADSAKMTQDRILNQLYLVFYTTCGYTAEELAMDNAVNGVDVSRTYPKFEISMKYTLTSDGLDVDLINDSIVDYESQPLIYVDVLPYFGCGTINDTGYSMIPDGSGVIIDFNNNRSYASAYNQRLYGIDFAPSTIKAPADVNQVSLGVYGMKANDAGFINIVTEGTAACAILANNSTTANPYNQAYYRFYYRESDTFSFSSISNTSNIISWSTEFNDTDLKLSVRGVDGDGNYSEMAKTYQKYLVDSGMLVKQDSTTNVVLDLSLLGGYLSDENFIGFKYKTPRSLTNAEQVQAIVNELLAMKIESMNVIYKGWSNDGIKSTYIGHLRYNNVITSRRKLEELQKFFEEKNISFYPEVSIARAYTTKDFNENQDAIRDIFGSVTYVHAPNEASFLEDFTTLPQYTLKSSTYSKTFDSLKKAFDKVGVKNVALVNFGDISYGSYESSDTNFRTDNVKAYLEAMDTYRDNYINVISNNAHDYALKYSNNILNVPTSGTNYQIVQSSVPFYQLVISGYLDYSGESFNLNDEHSFDYYKMKAIETASNFAMTWTYDTTTDLINTEYNTYYSTYYKNWIDNTGLVYNELNDLGIYQSSLSKHELITVTGLVAKSTYANGMEIVFNYDVSNYTYNGIVVPANSYRVVKEA